MASAAGVPERPPPPADAVATETEPLLGRPGDVAQRQGASVFKNLTMGTGPFAQVGVIVLVLLVWGGVFTHLPLILFSGHPLAQSLALLLLVQSILALQPTHTAEQKRTGQRIHAALNLLGFFFFLAGIIIIEYNKYVSSGPHFHSVHGYLGVITCVFILLQYFVGFTMWAVPRLYGGEVRAGVIWKYHRCSGYVLLVLLLVTVCSAMETSYNLDVLHIKLWGIALSAVLIGLGVFPRIQMQKLGITPRRRGGNSIP